MRIISKLLIALCLYTVASEHEYINNNGNPATGNGYKESRTEGQGRKGKCVDEKVVATLQSTIEQNEMLLSEYKSVSDQNEEQILALTAQIETMRQQHSECEAQVSSNEAKDEELRKIVDSYNEIRKTVDAKEQLVEKLKHENDANTRQLKENLRQLQEEAEKSESGKFDYQTFVDPWVQVFKFLYNVERYYFSYLIKNIPPLPESVRENLIKARILIVQNVEPIVETVMPMYTQFSNSIVRNWFVFKQYYTQNLKPRVDVMRRNTHVFIQRRFDAFVLNSNTLFRKILNPILNDENEDNQSAQNVALHADKLSTSPYEVAALFWLFCVICYFQFILEKKILKVLWKLFVSVLSCLFCCWCLNRCTKQKTTVSEKKKSKKKDKEHHHSVRHGKDKDKDHKK